MSNRNKPNKSRTNDFKCSNKFIYYTISIVFLGFGVGCIHVYHVSTLFENDRHFSHLSTLEREMTFRTEMGLYYSYYKTLVEAPTFLDGLYQITHDNRTEYPSVINTLQRFNLYPEVVISLLYRCYNYIAEKMNFHTKQCWHVDRGRRLPPITSCEGLGDPTYFYLEMVWWCAGFTMALIFLFGLFLSGNVAGGLLSVLCFFYNHSECTRVQWTPPLRESFAYPFCVLQMLAVTRCLRIGNICYTLKISRSLLSWINNVMTIWIPTWIFLLLWQFAQFVLTTQILAIFVLYALGIIDKNTFLVIVFGVVLGVLHAALCLFINEFLVFSFLTCVITAILLIMLLLDPLLNNVGFGYRSVILCVVATFLSLTIKTRINHFSGHQDDVHIMNLLKAKLTKYKDFHTLLYTCSAEFDFLPLEFVKNTSTTLLLPSAFLALLAVFWYWWNIYIAKWTKSRRSDSLSFAMKLRTVCEPEVTYNILQLAAFAVMAILIMRLKLFLTPQLCLITSLLALPKLFRWPSHEIRLAALFLLIGGMSVKGIQNVKEQRSVLGEYSNLPMEELLTWINATTNPDAVFAGPMPVMANVLLSTRRPVVNHPHYEDAMLRARTKKVYSVFSRKTAQEVYVTLSQMQVDFIILEQNWCFGESKSGCSMEDLWDIEDPDNINHPALCPILFKDNASPFHRVFVNEVYVVLQIRPQSQYVEFRPPKLFKQ